LTNSGRFTKGWLRCWPLTSQKAALEARLKKLNQMQVAPKIECNALGQKRRP
jgi:hypothetical protein